MGLELTGERTIPGITHENYWFRRHEVAYRFAAQRCAGLDVLDAGCGEGYGTAILDAAARSATGIELVANVCTHARQAYPELEFVEADLCDLPLPDDGADAVVSLQVIEHLWDIPRYLDETARVLRPGGLFVCGTPNRLTFTPGSDTPVNPFHTVEFTAAELGDLLATRFEVEEVLGVFHGPRLSAVEQARGTTISNLVLDTDPQGWPAWLTELVASVSIDDFEVRVSEVDRSLDLIALVRTPAEPQP